MVDRLENTVQKGRAFELLTKCFLQLDPKYATILKNVWSHNAHEVPDSILKKLNLPKPDEGIDIIAETYEGEFWSIQCKYIADESESMGRKKLATFTDLSFTICKNISLALICTPLDRFSYKLDKYYGDKISYCAGENYRDLGNDFFFRAKELFAGNKIPIKAYEPRDHQIRAIINAIEHFEDNEESRGKMIMPCGAGKSLTAYWIAQELLPKNVLIAVPSLSLVRQTLEVWARECIANNENFRWICVCSDETVKDAGNDDQSVLAQDLGVKVNGDPKEIAKWLTKETTSTNIVFSTYQSGKTLTEAAKLARATFDLGIFDEAHKTVGVRDKLFAHMLFDKNIKIHKRLFMTATERQYRGDSDEILSMDNTDVYGETFEVLSFKEALACDPPILSDYKVVTLAVTTDEIKELINANVFVRPEAGKVDEEVEAKMLAAALQVRKTMSSYPVRHCLSFHSSIARAEAFQKTHQNINQKFGKYGNLDCFHIRGSMPTSVRKKKLDQSIESNKSLVTNARCLTEGIDVKEIDGVLFADPKGSTIDIVQAVGRALRPHPQKEFGYVMIPVLLDSEKLGERIAQNEAYEDLLMTMRALASNDDRIVDYLKAVADDRKPPSGSFECEFKVSKESDFKLEDFARDVSLKIWSKLAKLSWMPFEEAREFVRKLKLKGQVDWREYIRNGKTGFPPLPEDIPKSPEATYKRKGWLSWGDWLGHANIKGNPNFQKKDWRPFEQARKFAQSLDLKNQKEWVQYRVGKMPELESLPSDIPKVPESAYREDGWDGYGDWLGTGNFRGSQRKGGHPWRPFKEAREFARSLGFKNQNQWKEYSAKKINGVAIRPNDIPSAPDHAYKNSGWKGYRDWLGTGKKRIKHKVKKEPEWRPFEEARSFVQKLGLKSMQQWEDYKKGKIAGLPSLPDNIPKGPRQTYRDSGWRGWPDWLGYDRRSRINETWLSYEDSRAFVHSLKLKTAKEWSAYTKGKRADLPSLPQNIPISAHRYYKDSGWISWADWLGNGKRAKGSNFLPFVEARAFVRSLNLQSRNDWLKYKKGEIPKLDVIPTNIPKNPDVVYRHKGWKSFGDWLGTGKEIRKNLTYMPYDEAKEFAKSLKIKNSIDWLAYTRGKFPDLPKLPLDIPKRPREAYLDKGWKGYGDWLGTGRKSYKVKARGANFLPFEEARNFIRSLNLKNTNDWILYSRGKLKGFEKLPLNIPKNPSQTYSKDGWDGMKDWLGTKTEYQPFENAREFARSLNLKSSKEWIDYCKGLRSDLPPKPENIPNSPNLIYSKDGWDGMKDWLGTKIEYQPFENAREFARSLNLKSSKEWIDYCKGLRSDLPSKPEDIPSSPDVKYHMKGWKNMPDWLGYKSDEYILPFEKARQFIQSLNLEPQNSNIYRKYLDFDFDSLPKPLAGLPRYPDKAYKELGWISYLDWMADTDKWLSFYDARDFVRKLGIKSNEEWKLYAQGKLKGFDKIPEEIPKFPNISYATKGWSGIADWLGYFHSPHVKKGKVSDEKSPTEWIPFEKARNFVRSLKLSSKADWVEYCSGLLILTEKPSDIPADPDITYKDNGWVDWQDWVGFKWMPFDKAKDFTAKLKLKDAKEWKSYVLGEITGLPAKPSRIPANPEVEYGGRGWIGYNHWLGHEDGEEMPSKWTEIVNYLDQFNQSYGHFKVPETEQFKQLKSWIQTVRSRKSEGTLDSELQEMLEQINFDWGQ